jgi:adenine-specific DNA-methyltransferase
MKRNERKSNIELMYKGKEKEFLSNIQSVPLQEVKRYGDYPLDGWYNLLIFGDNLSVMKTLMNRSDIKGQVRLVYIDPPFSTKQVFKSGILRTSTISSSDEDQIAYQDLLVGAEYLEFLRKRLILLKELLADNGSIYVHTDCKIGHYVKVLMDEIFGQEHFINDITRIKCNPKNFKRKGYGNIKDMILFYSKTDNFVWNGSYTNYTKEQLEKLFPKVDKDGRRYTTTPLHAPGETKNGPTGQPWRGILPPKGRHWRYPPAVLDELDRQGLIEWSKTGNPRKKIYADKHIRKIYRQDVWEFKDPQYPTYPTEKNLEMLKVIIDASSNKEDIVLDCFSGSGTTLIAAEQLGRRWIGIDNSPKAIEITLRRLQSLERVRPFILYNCSSESLLQLIQEIL